MDGSRFDTLVKALAADSRRQLITPLATTPLTRANAVRGLVAGAAALAAVTRTGQPGAADRKKDEKKRKVCHCLDTTAATCRTLKKEKKKVRKHLRRHPCDYKGRCTGVSGCSPGLTATPTPTLSPALTCTPNCVAKDCGDDGCGGSCGTCSGLRICSGGDCVCADRTCAGGQCAVDTQTCCPEDLVQSPCTGTSAADNCYCVTTTEGTKRCHEGGQQACDEFGACASSSECPDGTFCNDTAIIGCLGFCLRGCNTAA
jgi:hypothetical protein